MKLIKILLAVQLVVLLNASVQAQQGNFKLELNYTVGLPVGGLHDVTDKTSWRGGEIAFMYGITDRASIGLQVGQQDFYQRYPRTVFHGSGTDISAVITNSIQVMPIMAKGTMRFGTMGSVQPFVSLAAGGNFIQYRKFYGEFADSRYKLGFAAQPSAGIHVPFGRAARSGFHIAAGFNFMPFKYADADGLHHGVVKAGVSFPLQ